MNNADKLLSDVAVFRSYANYIEHLNRRETFDEIIERNMVMNIQRFPRLARELVKAYDLVREYKIMPSMRTLQFAGKAIEKNNLRGYNCSGLLIDNSRAFSELFFLLLSGTGVGYSVQKRYISNLPIIKLPIESGYYRVHDSIEGWSEALDTLIRSYMYRSIKPQFDFSAIRIKGSIIKSCGAKAPGSQPLMHMLQIVENKLKIAVGRKLESLEVHDICCHIADAVLSGGIRRAAMISLFDKDDNDMLNII